MHDFCGEIIEGLKRLVVIHILKDSVELERHYFILCTHRKHSFIEIKGNGKRTFFQQRLDMKSKGSDDRDIGWTSSICNRGQTSRCVAHHL